MQSCFLLAIHYRVSESSQIVPPAGGSNYLRRGATAVVLWAESARDEHPAGIMAYDRR